jgi:hypothetical protein
MLDLILFCLPQILIIPLAFFFVTCPCCGSCEICTDDFTRADSTDIDTGSSCGWTETAGSWEIASNTLRTASSNAEATCDTTHPDAVPSHYVSVSMYGATSDELIVHVGTTHKAIVTIGSPNGCLALYDGGTLLTKMLIDAPATTAKTLKVWYGLTPVADGADSQLAAQWDAGTILRYNVTRAGNGVALGTGTIASTVRFDDFIYEKHYTTTDTPCKKPDAPTCTIVSDSFGRADSSNIGCGFTETSGSFAIATNKLECTSSTAKATCETIHPQASGAVQVSVSVSGANDNDVIKVWTDATGNNYAQAIVGTSKTLKVFEGGVERSSATLTTTAGTPFTMTVTQSRDSLNVEVGSVCVSAQVNDPAGPIKVALGTGSITSAVTFDSFILYRGYDSSNTTCQYGCYRCNVCTGTVPRFVEIEYDGVAAGGAGCTAGALGGCSYWNTTVFEVPIISNCRWLRVQINEVFLEACTEYQDGAFDTLYYDITLTGTGVTGLEINAYYEVSGVGPGVSYQQGVFLQDTVASADCATWDLEAVDSASATTWADLDSGTGPCDWTNATLYYTAVV